MSLWGLIYSCVPYNETRLVEGCVARMSVGCYGSVLRIRQNGLEQISQSDRLCLTTFDKYFQSFSAFSLKLCFQTQIQCLLFIIKQKCGISIAQVMRFISLREEDEGVMSRYKVTYNY